MDQPAITMMPTEVAGKFANYPAHVRPCLEKLRALIFDVASHTPGVGQLEECLKWGEPAYLTSQTKSGTTIRFDWSSKRPEHFSLLFNCQSNVISQCKDLLPELDYQGNREIRFALSEPLAQDSIRLCVQMALTYHLRKKS